MSRRPPPASRETALAYSSDGVEEPTSYVKFYPEGSIDDLRFRFMRRLVVSARRWRARVDQRLKRIDQTQARWETLLALSARSEGLTQGELARLLSVEDPTIARMLTALEQDGAVHRLVGEDRRQRIVRITQEGEKALATMQVITDLMRKGLLQDLDDEELVVGMRVLDKILGRLEQP